MIFKNKITIKEDRLFIEISCKKRDYSAEEKYIFDENIETLIPEEYKKKVVLVSSPVKKISNIGRENYSQVGVWEYKIIKENPPTTESKTAKRSPRRKQFQKTKVKA